MVGRVDAGRIVDGVGVDAPALARIFDAAELRRAEIGAFADDLGAHLAAVDAHRVVGAVAGVDIGSAPHALMKVPMPPKNSRSTSAFSSALISSAGDSLSTSSPVSAFTSGDSGISFSVRGKTPPPLEISDLS